MTDQTKSNLNMDGTPSDKIYPDLDLVKKVLHEPFNDKVAELQVVMQDRRYSAEHKQKTVASMIDDGYTDLEANVKHSIGQLQSEVKKLREQQRVSITPPAEEVAQIAYVKDALTARWKTLDAHAIARGWEDALASKDKVALRVYADFAESEMATRKSPSGLVHMPSSVQKLRDQTDDILHPGTRQARLRADKLEMTIPIIEKSLRGKLEDFRRTRFTEQGELHDPRREALRRMIRG